MLWPILAANLMLLAAVGPQVCGERVTVREDGRISLESWIAYNRCMAEQGDPEAQSDLGSMHAEGNGVPQDYVEAVRWFRMAAEQGEAFAQYNLGVILSNGHGVPQDYAEAVRWYRKAAEQGSAPAQVNLGFMFDNGYGVPQDHAGAARWFRKAAEQGEATAFFKLGFMYLEGRGVPQDYMLAHMWSNLAGSRLTPGETRDLAIKIRDSAAVRMTPRQIAEAQRLAREWQERKP